MNSTNCRKAPSTATPTPLTPAVVRALLGWPQIRVAAMAGVGVASVRLYEIDASAILDREKHNALAGVYARMRSMLLGGARA